MQTIIEGLHTNVRTKRVIFAKEIVSEYVDATRSSSGVLMNFTRTFSCSELDEEIDIVCL